MKVGSLKSLGLPFGSIALAIGVAIAAALSVESDGAGVNLGPDPLGVESIGVDWLVTRLAALAVLVLATGVGLRSERLVSVACAPALVSLVLATGSGGEVAWGRAVLLGCLWYLAIEVALSSIELGGGLELPAAVIQGRLAEVATVVTAAALVGLAGFAVVTRAPDRTLFVRAVVGLGVLAGLVLAGRYIRERDPS